MCTMEHGPTSNMVHMLVAPIRASWGGGGRGSSHTAHSLPFTSFVSRLDAFGAHILTVLSQLFLFSILRCSPFSLITVSYWYRIGIIERNFQKMRELYSTEVSNAALERFRCKGMVPGDVPGLHCK